MTAAVYRTAVFCFSIACYGAFLLVFLYLLAFLGNLQMTPIVSRSIDLGRNMGSPLAAVLVDGGLILLFGLQHSVMARPGFKRVWTRAVPKQPGALRSAGRSWASACSCCCGRLS